MPRSRLHPPQHSDRAEPVTINRLEVHLRHPGWDLLESCPLLILPAHDGTGTLHHETARLACAIVADNRIDGFLSRGRDGTQRIHGPDTALEPGVYWFQVPNENGLDPEYPIVPHILDWQFRNLPDYWKQMSIETSSAAPPQESKAKDIVRIRDKSCRMTASAAAAEVAHLVPRALNDWFNLRGLAVYDEWWNPSNALLLRADLHQLLDNKNFAFIPRSSGQNIVMVAYVLKKDCLAEVIEMYHDVELQQLNGIRLEFLYCRFAYTIFEALRGFMQQGLKRNLKVCVEGNKFQARWYEPAETKKYSEKRSRSRNPSPQKRQRVIQEDSERDQYPGYSSSQERKTSSSPSLIRSPSAHLYYDELKISKLRTPESIRERKRRRENEVDKDISVEIFEERGRKRWRF